MCKCVNYRSVPHHNGRGGGTTTIIVLTYALLFTKSNIYKLLCFFCLIEATYCLFTDYGAAIAISTKKRQNLEDLPWVVIGLWWSLDVLADQCWNDV